MSEGVPSRTWGDVTSCWPWFSLVTRHCCLAETINACLVKEKGHPDETQPRKATLAVAMREEQKAKIPGYIVEMGGV